MAPKAARFSDGERILCFHGPLMYEAKCMKADMKEKGFYYLIHYNGWNKHWDEWVPEARVLKYNDSNLRRQKDLLKQHGKDKTRRGKPGKPGKLEEEREPPEKVKKIDVLPSPSEPKKKKTRSESTVDSEEVYRSKVEVAVKVSEEVKIFLLDDWDLVCRQRQLFKIPAKKTVENILDDYMKHSAQNCTEEEQCTTKELCFGIREYFNVMLGSQLLYKLERPQNAEILEKFPDKTSAQTYGAAHLCRFFVKLGSLLCYTHLSEKNMSLLLVQMQLFIKYVQDNSSILFDLNEYELPSPEYNKKATT